MEEEIKVGDITMSQVEAAWDTLMKATDAIDEGIQSGDEGATRICVIMCLRHMLFGARFNATTKIATAKMEAKMEAKVKEDVPVAKPEGVNFSLMPSGEKSVAAMRLGLCQNGIGNPAARVARIAPAFNSCGQPV